MNITRTIESIKNKKWINKQYYKKIKQFQHPILGSIKVYQHKTQKNKIFSKTQIYNDKQSCLNLLNFIDNRFKLNHQNILKLLDYSI